MKELLKKNLYFALRHQKGSFTIALIFILSSAVLKSQFLLFYSVLALSYSAVYIINQDEKDGFTGFAALMPEGRKKYCGGLYLYSLTIGVVCLTVLFIMALSLNLFEAGGDISQLLLCFSECFIVPAVVLPLNLKYGFLAARVPCIIFIGVLFGLMSTFGMIGEPIFTISAGAGMGILAASVIIFTLSWYLSPEFLKEKTL